MRAVKHRVVLVDAWVGPFTTKHKTGHFRGAGVVLRDDLVKTRSAANLTAVSQRRARQQIPRLRAMNVTLERFGVIQPADEDHPVAEVVERMLTA